MKPHKTRSLSPIMERHTPQHPLPAEIKSLPKDETVCQFCGVSYLIHHEMKKLEELVEQLEKDLEEHRGAVEREKKIRGELDKSKNAIEYLNQILKQKDEIISNITNEIEEVKFMNEKLRSDLTSEQDKRNTISNNFLLYKQKMKSCLTSFQSDAKSLKSGLSDLRNESTKMKNDMTTLIGDTIAKLPDLTKACVNEFSSIHLQNAELRSNIENSSSQISEWKAKAAKRESEAATLKEAISSSDISREQKENEFKQKIHELEKLCADQAQTISVSEVQVKSLQANAALMDENLKKKQSELQNTVFKMQKSEENATDTIRRLTQDSRDMERKLTMTKDELKKIKDLLKEKEKRDRELLKQETLNNFQMEEVSKALAEAKTFNQTLLEERNSMVLSHQNQIQQLRDNFKKLLAESDGSIKAERELEVLRDKHRVALDSLEKALKKEFQIELDVEMDKFSEAMSNIKANHRDNLEKLENNFQSQLATQKTEIATLKQKLESLTTSMELKQKECEEEKCSLKNLISQLEDRITELTGEQENNNLTKKLEINDLNHKLQEALLGNEELERNILQMKEEINLLQDTVRRECEERYELTDALSQARQQLKESKNHNSSLSNSAQSINPVSAVNKLNPGGIDAELTTKLSNRTLRSLESDYSSPSPHSIRNGTVPSLRSLPDVLPKRDLQQFSSKASFHDSSSMSTNITDISFNMRDVPPRRSSSNSSLQNGQSSVKNNFYNNSGRAKALVHSESADSVDQSRKRIAAAIKRK